MKTITVPEDEFLTSEEIDFILNVMNTILESLPNNEDDSLDMVMKSDPLLKTFMPIIDEFRKLKDENITEANKREYETALVSFNNLKANITKKIKKDLDSKKEKISSIHAKLNLQKNQLLNQ